MQLGTLGDSEVNYFLKQNQYLTISFEILHMCRSHESSIGWVQISAEGNQSSVRR